MSQKWACVCGPLTFVYGVASIRLNAHASLLLMSQVTLCYQYQVCIHSDALGMLQHTGCANKYTSQRYALLIYKQKQGRHKICLVIQNFQYHVGP